MTKSRANASAALNLAITSVFTALVAVEVVDWTAVQTTAVTGAVLAVVNYAMYLLGKGDLPDVPEQTDTTTSSKNPLDSAS